MGRSSSGPANAVKLNARTLSAKSAAILEGEDRAGTREVEFYLADRSHSIISRLPRVRSHSIFDSILKTTNRLRISTGRDEELFIPRGHTEIARLRPRSHVH